METGAGARGRPGLNRRLKIGLALVAALPLLYAAWTLASAAYLDWQYKHTVEAQVVRLEKAKFVTQGDRNLFSFEIDPPDALYAQTADGRWYRVYSAEVFNGLHLGQNRLTITRRGGEAVIIHAQKLITIQ